MWIGTNSSTLARKISPKAGVQIGEFVRQSPGKFHDQGGIET